MIVARESIKDARLSPTIASRAHPSARASHTRAVSPRIKKSHRAAIASIREFTSNARVISSRVISSRARSTTIETRHAVGTIAHGDGLRRR
tara:strand:+ start:131 stop:403 length:273 start_codon:yes stop_codon:yes gene_type:complete